MLVFSQGVFEQEWHFGYHLRETDKEKKIGMVFTMQSYSPFRKIKHTDLFLLRIGLLKINSK